MYITDVGISRAIFLHLIGLVLSGSTLFFGSDKFEKHGGIQIIAHLDHVVKFPPLAFLPVEFLLHGRQFRLLVGSLGTQFPNSK